MHGISALVRTRTYRRLRKYREDQLRNTLVIMKQERICTGCGYRFYAPIKSNWFKCDACRARELLNISRFKQQGKEE